MTPKQLQPMGVNSLEQGFQIQRSSRSGPSIEILIFPTVIGGSPLVPDY